MVKEVEAPEDYRNFVKHVDKVKYDHPIFDKLAKRPRTDQDYANCKIAANYIAYQLLGMLDEDGNKKKPDYWADPEYEKLSPIEIELKIIREQGRVSYGLNTRHGIPLYQHVLVLTKLVFPETDITPVLADITQLFCLAFTHGRKFLHLLGSQDSGKSSTIARLVFVFMLIDPVKTFAPIASPFVNTSETIIWGDILELWEQINTHHGFDEEGRKGNKLFPDGEDTAGRVNFTKQARGKAGWAAVRNLKKAGKLIGSKNVGSDEREGIGLIAFDEINRAESTGFMDELANPMGQPWFQMITAQNPRDEADVGGQLATPKVWKNWGPSSFAEIRKDDNAIWPTVKAGIAYRLNGLDSVNMRLGKIVYPYQFNHEKHELLLEEFGESSIEYYSQCLALFSGADMMKKLLSQTRISQSKHLEEDFIMTKIHGKVMFNDPAHSGHGDKACIGTALFGEGIVTNTDGTQEQMPLFVVNQPMEHVNFITNFKWIGDPEHPDCSIAEKIFGEIGGDYNNITIGSDVSYEQQIAARMAQRAKEENIPYRNIGFDFSMRYEMVAAVNLFMGHEPVQYDYNTKALGYYLQSTKEETEIKCPQRNGRLYELGYLTADLFNSKQLRGGEHIRVAIIQCNKTVILTEKPNHPFEDKRLYKARNENKSPDERDTLFGLVGMAFMRGFRVIKTPSSTVSSESIFRKSLNQPRFKRKGAKKL